MLFAFLFAVNFLVWTLDSRYPDLISEIILFKKLYPSICVTKAIAPEHKNKTLKRKLCTGFVVQKRPQFVSTRSNGA